MASSDVDDGGGDSGIAEADIAEYAQIAVHSTKTPVGATRRPARRRTSLYILLAVLCVLPYLALTLITAVAAHILVPGGELAFQELNPRLPVPVLLNWPSPLVQAAAMLADFNPVARGAFNACWLLAALIALSAAVNPNFRPVSIGRDGSNRVHGALMISRGAFGVWLVSAVSVAFVAAISHVIFPVHGGADFAWLAAGAVAGMLVGPAGAFGDPGQIARRGPLLRSAAVGAVVGFGSLLSMTCSAPVRLSPLLVDYQMLGTFNLRYLRQIAFSWLAGGLCTAAAICLVVVALLAPRQSLHNRLLTLIAAVVCVGAGASIRQPFTESHLASRMDITRRLRRSIPVPYSAAIPASGVPDGTGAGAAFAAAAHIAVGASDAQPNRSLLLFTGRPQPVITCRESGFTEDAVSGSLASAAATMAFLRRRRFQTALSWEAVKQLFNVATIHFDDTGAMRALLLDLDNSPHAEQDGATLRSMLFTCAATPANRAILDAWCDPHRFVTFNRFATRMYGDLYLRFGDTKLALRYYRAAGMPASFLSRTASQRPLFHRGEVSGRLLLNGVPVAGAQVGVIPVRLNGLPPDLEPVVFRSLRDVLAPYRFGVFPPYHPRPFALRWIVNSVVSNADGSFSVNDLTEGEYVLICAMPPRYRFAVPLDANLRLQTPVRAMRFSYGHPTVALGNVRLSVTSARIKPGGPDAAGPR
ncbi:MAG: hypothetical protein KGJ62_04875 [Armatimonadetes bacterium]|nr:hypothetical protein [Armatimonadota bacterium]MDE2205394.1 hypothetical protein [Armatimonadota bacterium]